MAKVEIIHVEKQMNNEVVLTIEARTSMGRIPIQIRLGDHGSPAMNEKLAFQEALAAVEEIAAAIRLHLGL